MMPKAIFPLPLPDNRKIKISDDVLQMMFSFAQDHKNSPESGGILIGRVLDCNSSIIVDHASQPMESDVQTRHRFIRKAAEHQEFFNQIWESSEGRCFYFGEWHTHPETHPTPSAIDKREWRKLLEKSIQDQNQLFFVIVGTTELVVWYGQRQANKDTFLKLGYYSRNEIQN